MKSSGQTRFLGVFYDPIAGRVIDTSGICATIPSVGVGAEQMGQNRLNSVVRAAMAGIALTLSAGPLTASAQEQCAAFDLGAFDAASSGESREWVFGHDAAIGQLDISPNERLALTGGDDRTVRLWDAETFEEIRRFEHDADVESAVTDSEWTHLATYSTKPASRAYGNPLSMVRIWNLSSGDEIRALHFERSLSLEALPRSSRILVGEQFKDFSAGGERTVFQLIDMTTAETVATFPVAGRPEVHFSPGGTRMLIDAKDQLELRHGETGALIADLSAEDRSLGAAFLDSGRKFLVWDREGAPRLFDSVNGEPLRTPFEIPGEKRTFYSAAVNEDGIHFALESSANEVLLWDGVAPEPVAILESTNWPRGIHFLPEVNRVLVDYSAGRGTYSAALFDLMTGAPVGPERSFDYPVHGPTLSPDGLTLVLRGGTEAVSILDPRTGLDRTDPLLIAQGTYDVIFTPDSQIMFTSGGSGAVSLWDTATGERLGPVLGHAQGIDTLFVKSDQSHVLVQLNAASAVARWDLSWAKKSPDTLRACGDKVLTAAAEDRQAAMASRRSEAVREIDEIVTRQRSAKRRRQPREEGSLVLSQQAFPDDFARKSMRYHPIDSYHYALTLFAEGQKELATFWMYVADIRFRTRNMCYDAQPGQAEYALLAVSQQNIGSEINAWAFGDLALQHHILGQVQEWYDDAPDPFAPLDECGTDRTEVVEGLLSLRQTILDDAEDLRASRAESGLENREFGDQVGDNL